jgi:hypothetical protein
VAVSGLGKILISDKVLRRQYAEMMVKEAVEEVEEVKEVMEEV